MTKIKNAKAVWSADGKIKFRSKLELVCYELLEKHNVEFEYEPMNITLVEGFRYETPSWEKIGKPTKYKPQRTKVAAIKYMPDFVGDGWVIECKGFFTPLARLKWKLFKKWLVENDKQWDLYMPSCKRDILNTIELIKNHENT